MMNVYICKECGKKFQNDSALKADDICIYCHARYKKEEKPIIVDKYVVFKGRKSSLSRNDWLELYEFSKDNVGKYYFTFTFGWHGYYDNGGGRRDLIPKEWLSFDWKTFLNVFLNKYPEKDYLFGKRDLEPNEGLKVFLGFV